MNILLLGLFCLIDGAKLGEGFSTGFRDEPPSKECGKSTHTSMEEEDGRKSKMQDHVGDRLDEGKDGDAPEPDRSRGFCALE